MPLTHDTGTFWNTILSQRPSLTFQLSQVPLSSASLSSSTCPVITLISLYCNYFYVCVWSYLFNCLFFSPDRKFQKARLSVLFIIVNPEPGRCLPVCRCLVSISWMNKLVNEWKIEWNGLLNELFFSEETCPFNNMLLKIVNSSIIWRIWVWGGEESYYSVKFNS